MHVELSKDAKKSISKAPPYIASKLLAWVNLVEIEQPEVTPPETAKVSE